MNFKIAAIVAASFLASSATAFAQGTSGSSMEGGTSGKMSSETSKDPSMMKKDKTMMKSDGMKPNSTEKSGAMTGDKSDMKSK